MKYHNKTSLLSLALFFAFAYSTHAQITYQHYLNSTYAWYETQTGIDWGCYLTGSYTQRGYHHIVGTDSLSGYWWYKIHSDFQSEAECNGTVTIDPVQPAPGVVFRIREDSTGKIWMRENNGNIQMMYDFRPGLGIGDTLWMMDYTDYIEIDSIDTLNLGLEKRARYWATCSQPMVEKYVVEGIGANRGFSNFWLPLCDVLWDVYLAINCAKKGGATLVIDNNFPCGVPGHVIVGLEEKVEMGLRVHWDGSQERLVLRDWQSLTPRSWAVFDISGKVLAKGDQLEAEIALPGLGSGIYVLLVNPAPGEKPLVKKFLR